MSVKQDELYPHQVFELEPYDEHGNNISLSSAMRVEYQKALDEKDVKFIHSSLGRVAKLYELSRPSIRIFLDEAFPSIRIGKTVYAITRENNPNVIVALPKNEKLCVYLIALLNLGALSVEHRIFAFKRLQDLGVCDEIICNIYEYASVLFSIDPSTLRRDLKSAK